MSASIDPELRRVVTVCAAKALEYNRTTDQIGLAFCDRTQNLSREDQVNLMLHPDVRGIFKNFYYGMLTPYEPVSRWSRRGNAHEGVPEVFFIGAGGQCMSLIGDDQPFFLLQHAHLFETTKKQLFERCWLMHKWIGCDSCLWAGDRCIHTFRTPGAIATSFNSPQRLFPFMEEETSFQPGDDFGDKCSENILDWPEWRERRLKTWRDRIAGFVYIPPTATDSDPMRPDAKAIRTPYHANFTNLEETQGAFSDRSAAGRRTQVFIEKQCRACYFGGTSYRDCVKPCNKYAPRWCEHGAWTEERLVDYTLEIVEASLAKSQLSVQDVWKVACAAGVPFKLKDPNTHRPREWVISRVTEPGGYGSDKQVQVELCRTARNARHETQYFATLDALREVLPKFMREYLDTEKELDRKALALWMQVAAARTGRSYSFYFSNKDACGFGSYQPTVNHVSFDSYLSVRVCYMQTKKSDSVRLRDFDEVYQHFQDLLLFHITKPETPKMASSLSVWVR